MGLVREGGREGLPPEPTWAGPGALPPASAVVDRLSRRRGMNADGAAFVTIAAMCIVASTMTSIHAFRDVMLAVPLVVVPAAAARWRTHPRATGWRLPLGLSAFLLWCAASYGWSADPSKSAHLILEYLAVGVAGAAIGIVLSPRQVLHCFVLASKGMVLINGVDLIVRHHSATAPGPGNPPGWHAFFGQKNDLGFEMALALITIAVEQPRTRRQYLWLLAAAVMLVGSQSGAGLSVTLAVASVAIWLWILRNSLYRSTRVALKSISIALAVAAVFFITFDLPTATGILGKNATLTGRTKIWSAVVHAIGHNWFHGYGYGGVWASNSGETARLWAAIGFHAFEAHDQYLDTLLQLGVVGMLLLLGVLLSAWRRALGGVVGAGPEQRWILYVLLAFCLEGAVESAMFDFSLLTLAPVLVAAGALPRRDRAEVWTRAVAGPRRRAT